MLDGLLPDDIVTSWGDPSESATGLFPEEEALVARAVPKRRLEFAKGRECARRALAELGHPRAILLSGRHREPLWPAGIVGSITHTSGLCAVAVGRAGNYEGIGIDAEPAEPLAPDIAKRVSTEAEVSSFEKASPLDRALAARLVFSTKEAFYKCVFPITQQFLGFEDVRVVFDAGTFDACLRVDAAPFAAGTHFFGRWRRAGTHVVTAAWISANRLPA